MAAIGKKRPVQRVSPLKPGLTGARNWATAQIRSASYTRRAFWRLTLSIVFIMSSIGFLALWLGGFLPDARKASSDFTQNRLMSMGFVVDRVDVMGEGRLSEPDVRKALGVNQGDYLFALDLKAAQQRVENISWVERAIVRRLWPDRIVVQIIERKPYALWQNDGVIRLVDYEGNIISDVALAEFPELPLILGHDAPQHFASFDQLVNQHIEFTGQVDSFVHHSTGRWDIVMKSGAVRIKLPKDNTSAALTRLSNLQAQTHILDREVSVIDLRLADRITLSPKSAKPA